MWPNPQETADLNTFTEESLMENFTFCAVLQKSSTMDIWHGTKYVSVNTLQGITKWHGKNFGSSISLCRNIYKSLGTNEYAVMPV